MSAALALAATTTPARAESLFDAIQLAYATNPTLRAQQAELRSVDEGYVQARTGFGPQANVSGQVGYQAARVQEPASFFTPATTTTYKAGTGSADLSVVQPLYTAGATTAQVRAASAGVLAGRQSLRQAEGQLILNVVTAYEDVRRDREEMKILRAEIAALTGEAAEIEAKVKLGALSRTDSAEADARLLATQAQLDQLQGRLNASTAEYLDVVGQNPGELEAEPTLPGMPGSADDAFEAADHNNAQLLGAIENERAARGQVDEAKAANGPSVSLKLDAAVSPIEPYLPKQYDQSLTAAVVFNQPLFTSGLNGSKVRQALEEDNRAELTIESTRRDVVQQVSQAWAQLTSAQRSIATEQRQIDAETTSVQGNRAEERVGLRSTIDLLNAETELANSQISLVQSHHDEFIAKAALLSVMGLLEVRYLTPDRETYDPVRSLKHVQNRDAAPWEGAIASVDSLGAPNAHEPRLSAPDAGAERPADLQPQSDTAP